jgi:hypothetical protein
MSDQWDVQVDVEGNRAVGDERRTLLQKEQSSSSSFISSPQIH